MINIIIIIIIITTEWCIHSISAPLLFLALDQIEQQRAHQHSIRLHLCFEFSLN